MHNGNKTPNTAVKQADDLKTDLTNTEQTLSTKKKTSLELQNISAAKHTPGVDLESILTVTHKGVVGNTIRNHSHSF